MDLLNRMPVMYEDGGALVPTSLDAPVEHVVLGQRVMVARAARLPCGLTRTGDFVILHDGSAGFVLCFASADGGALACSANMRVKVADLPTVRRAVPGSVSTLRTSTPLVHGVILAIAFASPRLHPVPRACEFHRILMAKFRIYTLPNRKLYIACYHCGKVQTSI